MRDRFLICTDLDRTLIPNGPQSESPGAREHFASLAARDDITLAYVTGRDRRLVERAMNHFRLPVPDLVVADVGTTIYRVGAGRDWTVVREWEEAIEHDWAGLGHAELETRLAGLSLLRLQERSKQSRHKLSYYVPLHADRERLDATIVSRLQADGIRASLVWSVDEPAGVGLLDVLPASASKYHAIEACLRLLDFSHDNTVFGGDSGNDMDVLVSPINSVLVANSLDEVRAQALRLATEAGLADRLYVARGGFAGMNGNYAGGLLEGIGHYHPELTRWLTSGAPP